MQSVNFLPFIGEKYYNSHYGIRIMVIGESHYGDASDQKNDFTRHVVNEYAFKPGLAFFSKLTNLLRGSINYPTKEEREEAWQHISFYNYIQEFVGEEARIVPSREMWEAANEPFIEVVQTLKPDLILVLGTRLWNNLPPLPSEISAAWCHIIHPSSRMAYAPSIAAISEAIRKLGGNYP